MGQTVSRKLHYFIMPFALARFWFSKEKAQPNSRLWCQRASYLGFEESSAVVPDLSVLPAVRGGAHGGGPGVRCISSDRQILILGPVLYPNVHCRLRWGEIGI